MGLKTMEQNEICKTFEGLRLIHFVGFRDDRYHAAVKAFGPPDFIHHGWDLRARREIAEGDLIVFADGPHDQAPRVKSFDDIRE
jgi:hypothetical protein